MGSFELPFGSFKFVLAKKDVNFINGFGIAKATLLINYELEPVYFVAVVDKDYREVVPLRPTDNLQHIGILNNKTIMLTYNYDIEYSIDNNEIYICTYANGKTQFKKIDGHEYEKVTEDILKITQYYCGECSSYLYSISKDVAISDTFSYISEFKKTANGELVATARILVSFGEGINILECKITSSGEIVSDIEDRIIGLSFDKSTPIAECISKIFEHLEKNNSQRVKLDNNDD